MFKLLVHTELNEQNKKTKESYIKLPYIKFENIKEILPEHDIYLWFNFKAYSNLIIDKKMQNQSCSQTKDPKEKQKLERQSNQMIILSD